MPIYNGRTRISDENIWRVVDVKTTIVTPALYENLEENIQEDLQIGDFVLEITEVNQYISDDDVLDNKIHNINVPNGEIRKTYAVILSKENYNKLQYLTGFTTNTSYSTLGSLRNDINNLEANIVYLIRNNDKYDEYILAGSGNNKELVKIGDTSVTFDSSNLVDLSEFLQLRTDLKQSHDELSNRISSNAANISENTTNIQNLTNESLSIKNNLSNVEANVTTLKKEVWGSNTTTGDSRIDILEETTQKKERTEIDYLDMGTTTDPGYYNVVNQNGNGFSITYKTSENGASSTIENITKAPMDVYSTILNGVSYVMQRIIIGDKTYTRYLNVSSNTTSPWMAEPVVTNTVTNTPNKIPTSQAVVNYVPNPSSTTPSADTTSGSVGTGTTWARSNHTHPKSSLYAETNHTHGNITNDGRVGTSNNSNKNVVTDANGNITIEDKVLGGIELIATTNNSDEELAATSTTLSEVKEGTMILLKIINPFNTMRADSRLTLTLKNGEVLNRKLMKHPDFANYLPSNIVPSNTIFLMRYHDSIWFIIDQYNLATQSFRGFMSAEDKTKLDSINPNANQVNIDTALSETSTNPVQNKVIKEALDAKVDISSIPTLTQFKCHGTPGSNGYIKVFQIKINTTYQDGPISFSLMQRGTKQSAMVNIRFANENNNDPALDSFTFNGNNIGNNGEYYLYKESASTWSFIVRKWDAHDVINIYNMNTTNGGIAITSLNTQVSELPSGCIPASMIRNDLFFKTKNGSTPNYINLFEIRPTGNYQAKPITFEIVRQTKPTPIYVSVRLTNVTLASNTYAPQTIWSWGTSDTPIYIRKEADNVFNVIMYHLANEEISVCNMNNPNSSVKITPLGAVYGTDAPVTSGDNQVWKDTYTVGGTTFGTGTNNVIRGDDSRLSDTRNPKSTKINAGSDLDTYTTTGFYYNNSNIDCATITPLPQPNKAFFLQVEDWGTSNYTKQTITHYDPVKTYERIRNSGTWTDWHELQHNDGTGGENLLRTEPNNEGNSGVVYIITDEIFHNDKVYYRNETSQDTTKYSGWRWTIPRTEFDYGDVFTLSFYAKGTSDAEIRTYFGGASGYISNRRLSSNSDVDNTVSSYGDGATRFHLTSDWKRYYVTYQLHSTATTPTQNKNIHIRTLGASTDIEFYLSNVKLERGYYATDYDRHIRDNEPLYFPTEVSLPTTTTSEKRRKFIHPPYKFKNIPNWTIEGELKVTGSKARFDLHKVSDTTEQNFIAVGKNTGGNLAYWWSTSDSTETSKTYDASHIAVDTWYPFKISRMGDNVLFMFNNTDKYEITTTYFNTIDEIEPTLFRWGTSGASVRNLKIRPLEPDIPSKTSQLTDPSAYNNLGTSSDATQSIINTAIDTKIGDIETLIGDAITYINGTGGN